MKIHHLFLKKKDLKKQKKEFSIKPNRINGFRFFNFLNSCILGV